MKNIFSKIFNDKNTRQKAEEEAENAQIINDMKYVCSRLREIRVDYNMVGDNELIEAIIYEEKSLLAKYSYLLRMAKERKIKNFPAISE